MKPAVWLAVPLIVLCGTLVGPSSTLATGTYRQIASVEVPGLTAFDISYVDPSTQTYYRADRTHKGVDVVNAKNNAFLGRIGGFVGFTGNNDTSGPNGVVVVHSEDEHEDGHEGGGELWATDGNSTVKVFDLRTRERVATISTGGVNRADELALDQRDGLIVVANDAESPSPFVSIISVESRDVVMRIVFDDATNGIEQAVWDPGTNLFYIALPEVNGNHHTGEIAVVNPRTLEREPGFPVNNCQPHGLALGPHQHLLVGCSGDGIVLGGVVQTLIIDARNGSPVATITQVGGSDEVWFNPGDHRYYLASYQFRVTPSAPITPVLGVIDAKANTWITNVPTGPNPRAPVAGPHSVAVDPINNHIFVPLSELKDAQGNIVRVGQIGVFAAERHEEGEDHGGGDD